MSNPFKWYVYVSVDGEHWQRRAEFANSYIGQMVAHDCGQRWRSLKGIEAKVIRERRGEEK